MNKLNNQYSNIAVATLAFRDSFTRAFSNSVSLIGNWDWKSNKAVFDYEALEKAKLIIFTGGEDINPRLYNQENRHSDYSDKRDYIEEKIFKQALSLNKKMLGVCRGHQLINALLGGNLVQDIRTELNLSHGGGHDLDILTNNSVIGELFPDGVNSMHHQGVTLAGRNLIPTTWYNGVYESCESNNIITVQFHPEFMGREADSFFEFIKTWANLKDS